VSLINSAGPTTLEVMLERFWLAYALERLALNFSYQINNA
jgi:hypothetical protein